MASGDRSDVLANVAIDPPGRASHAAPTPWRDHHDCLDLRSRVGRSTRLPGGQIGRDQPGQGSGARTGARQYSGSECCAWLDFVSRWRLVAPPAGRPRGYGRLRPARNAAGSLWRAGRGWRRGRLPVLRPRQPGHWRERDCRRLPESELDLVLTADLMLTAAQGERLVELRRDFHRYPELAHQEHRTAGIVAERLHTLGLDEVRTGVGQTGVVGVLRGGRAGRTVMLRADMDGLPLTEVDRGQPYRSTYPGAHHACGHDGHTAILLTVAELLAARRNELPGTVTFVFQPAEERVDGAAGMLKDGALEPRPDACFGLHLWNEIDVGQIDARDGPVYASSDAFVITLGGPGGHGGMPHQVADPVVASAQLIVALQTLVSRESPPLEPTVLTIGSIHGGTAPNIIPTRVDLQGTLRVFDPELRGHLLGRLREHVHAIAAACRVDAEFRMTESCPACVNDPDMSALVHEVAERIVGPPHVFGATRTTGADDMSLFLDAVPGCYFFVGSANAERGLASPHHSPTFDFDERALDIGVQVLTSTAIAFLERG